MKYETSLTLYDVHCTWNVEFQTCNMLKAYYIIIIRYLINNNNTDEADDDDLGMFF